MKIFEIQVVNELVSIMKPGLCKDIDTFFAIRTTKQALVDAITEYDEYVKTIMKDHNVIASEVSGGKIKYDYEAHHDSIIINEKANAITKKEFDIPKVDISKADYKAVLIDLTMQEICYLDILFNVIQGD